jgi:hypothetical protein
MNCSDVPNLSEKIRVKNQPTNDDNGGRFIFVVVCFLLSGDDAQRKLLCSENFLHGNATQT